MGSGVPWEVPVCEIVSATAVGLVGGGRPGVVSVRRLREGRHGVRLHRGVSGHTRARWR